MKRPEDTSEKPAIIALVATRVRSARQALGWPRRELSARSGISPRYLAQLEAGEGNISIVLLERVAVALGVPIEQLLTDPDPQQPDVDRIATLYASATPALQGRIRALLAPDPSSATRAQRICLIGLRGAGKSTLGRMAAEKLHIPFVELAKEIETRAGMPISEIMALYGTDGYRRFEADAIKDIITTHDRVITAVSGGLVDQRDTYANILERFHTVWIKTSPAEHMARVRAQGDLRPMQGNPEAMDQLRSLLEARTPLYEQAHADVDTTMKPIPTSLNDLLTVIAKNRFLEVSDI
ncbi:MAG: helix-turn-helix transcriptional regulator [Rhodobacteraceae bacterium]|nr:helix-turn-helix transcriptional regulator [Paracoccaceae bacterium]